MKLGPKPLRVALCIVAVATAYLERPPTMRPQVFYPIVLIGLIIVNLAFSWGQHLERTRSRNRPTTSGTGAPGQSAGATATRRKPWLLLALGFAGATMIGISEAHETGIWLLIPLGLLVGSLYVYFVLKKFG
jgi:hypothetical protein